MTLHHSERPVPGFVGSSARRSEAETLATWRGCLARAAGVRRRFLDGGDRAICPACRQDRATRERLVHTLAEWAHDPEMRTALEASPGLCVPHLALAVEAIEESAVRDAVVALHIGKYKALAAELAEYSRKNDYRFSGEGFGKEKDSWIRAVKMMTGEKDGLLE